MHIASLWYIRSNRESIFCKSLSWMRGGTAGSGVSWAMEPLCAELRWLPACVVDCGDKMAAGTVLGCTGSTAVAVREPVVDCMRDGLQHKYIRQVNDFTYFTAQNLVLLICQLYDISHILKWQTNIRGHGSFSTGEECKRCRRETAQISEYCDRTREESFTWQEQNYSF